MVGQRFSGTKVLQATQHQRVRRVREQRQVRHHPVQPVVARRHHAGAHSG